MFRLLSASKKSVGVAIRPAANALATPMWRREAQRLTAALPKSKSFSTLLNKASSEKEEQAKAAEFRRSMSSAAAAPAKEEEQADSFSGIVNKYGILPFAGLLSVAAVSKEVYFLGAESLLLGNFVLTFFVGYVVAGDTVSKFLDGEKTAFRSKIDDIVDLQTAFYQGKVDEYKSRLGFAAWLEDVKKQEIETSRMLNEAQGFVARHEAQATTLRKLRGIVHEEYEAQMAENQKLSNDAANFVRTSFAKADQRTKDRAIDNAIADLGSAEITRPIGDCPVKSMFASYLEKQQQ